MTCIRRGARQHTSGAVSSPHGRQLIHVTCARGRSARVCLTLWTSCFHRAPLEQIQLSLAPQTCFERRLRRIVDVSIKATSSPNQSPIYHCTLVRATATQNHHIEQQSTLTSKPGTQTSLARHVVHRQVVHSGHPLVRQYPC